ncbi:hypothetical protein [Kibdelosporangium philippinense]|uniref:hypothetical protein n=1 Tax=Kibdelosporangium philippinense TaxID=211113 RepID=UPI00361C07CD
MFLGLWTTLHSPKKLANPVHPDRGRRSVDDRLGSALTSEDTLPAADNHPSG